MNFSKLNKLLNYLLSTLLIVLLLNIFIFQGIAGAISWTLAKLFIAPICLILAFVTILLIIISLARKKKIKQKILTLLLSLILAFPILMLFNILKVAYPANQNKVNPSITVSFPLNEKTIVGWGGNKVESNLPHATWASERWAYDLVMEPYNIGSKNLEDYGIYNKDIISPISGTIISSYDNEDDISANTEDFISSEGNHIYIKIDETGTFLLLNHLKKDSILVQVGDHVQEGDIIGKVGNSGSTSEPHLHIHHQRQDPTKTLHSTFAEGLPLYFKGIDDSLMPEKGFVIYLK
ncbi:M23 family metallopeptidase [Clostridium intestinale]|uniref:Cell wall endopeptidase n=1 Tax=Clostridium intestinale URNW TaxID=1294142 RepID=U2NK33_9CLOT|nr:M23 family metallopeptidase [Clostridium intestinale]ERK29508.1 cell wall endopeptidase [Clostridium intestinale URNW]